MSARILTANRLVDGAVVYLATDGIWSEHLRNVRLATDADAAAALEALGARDAAARVIVAPYLVEVAIEDGKVVPLRYRERIRAFGPSTHPEFARQALAS